MPTKRSIYDRALRRWFPKRYSVAGVGVEPGGRDISTLAAERDRFLIDLLALKSRVVAEG
jgi:hypothetical protein